MGHLRVSHPALGCRYYPCLEVCPCYSSAAAGDWVTRALRQAEELARPRTRRVWVSGKTSRCQNAGVVGEARWVTFSLQRLRTWLPWAIQNWDRYRPEI